MAVATTTRLAAVNMILSAAGSAPVTGYSSSDGLDAVLANQILEETSNEVQTLGWWFNTRQGPIELTPDGSDNIVLTGPPPALRVEAYTGNGAEAYTIRDGKLYDLLLGQNTFDAPVSLKEIVYLLEWTDLPEAARLYIARKAARRFIDHHVSDPALARLARQDEAEAMALLGRDEILSSNSRAFGPENTRIIDRNKALDWVLW